MIESKLEINKNNAMNPIQSNLLPRIIAILPALDPCIFIKIIEVGILVALKLTRLWTTRLLVAIRSLNYNF